MYEGGYARSDDPSAHIAIVLPLSPSVYAAAAILGIGSSGLKTNHTSSIKN